MNPGLQRLRAEIASDVRAFEARLDELVALPALAGDAGALAQAAVALHHAYGVPLDPTRVEDIRRTALGARTAVTSDFQRFDAVLLALGEAS